MPGSHLNLRGRAGAPIANRNGKLLVAAKGFRFNGKTWEKALLEVSLVQAAKGSPGLAIALLSKMYITITPEAAGISLSLNQNNNTVKTENRVVRLGEHLGDAGIRDVVTKLVGKLASRVAVPGGNGDSHG
jgi:hypothetical protein